jgi:hypothetical protein
MEKLNFVSALLKENKRYLYSTSIFSIMMNATWAILYSKTLKKINYDAIRCSNVVEWNNELFTVSLLSVIVDIIRIIMKLCSVSTKSCFYSFLSSMRECCLGLASLVILIAVTITFRNENEVPFCESLNTLNLVYVIVEWGLMGLVILVVCLIICFFSFSLSLLTSIFLHQNHITDYQLLRNDKEQTLL